MHRFSIKKIITRPIFKNFSLGLFSQILISIANFFNGLFVARSSSKEEFGIYTIATTIILIFASFQQALIHSPVLVLYHHKSPEARSLFIRSVNIGQWLIFVPVIGFSCLLILVFGRYIQIHPTYYLLFLLIPVMYLREYIRTVDYCQFSLKALFASDIIFSVCILVGSIGIVLMKRASSFNGIMVLVCAYCIATISRYNALRQIFKMESIMIHQALREIWKLGKWALVAITMGNIQNYGYIFIVNSMLSLKSVADISVARLFIRPFTLLVTSMSKIYISKGTELLAVSGPKRLAKFNNVCLIFLLGAWVAFFVIMLGCREFIIEHVFTLKYANIKGTIVLWAMYMATESVREIYENSVQVFQKYKILALLTFLTAVIVIAGCFSLIKSVGANGAILSLVAGSIFSTISIIVIFMKVSKNWSPLQDEKKHTLKTID
jgi:O-antigen/teichoic acid export membrane protein